MFLYVDYLELEESTYKNGFVGVVSPSMVLNLEKVNDMERISPPEADVSVAPYPLEIPRKQNLKEGAL